MGDASCSQNSQLVEPRDGEESAGVDGQPIIQEAGRVLGAETGPSDHFTSAWVWSLEQAGHAF